MPLLDKAAGTATARCPLTRMLLCFPAAGTAVSELSAVVVPAKLYFSVAAGTATALSFLTKTLLCFSAAGTAVSAFLVVAVLTRILLYNRCRHSDFSGMFASRFGGAHLHEFRSASCNTGLSSINLGKGFLSQYFLRFRPTHNSRHDGHRGLKITGLFRSWRKGGEKGRGLEVMDMNRCYSSRLWI